MVDAHGDESLRWALGLLRFDADLIAGYDLPLLAAKNGNHVKGRASGQGSGYQFNGLWAGPACRVVNQQMMSTSSLNHELPVIRHCRLSEDHARANTRHVCASLAQLPKFVPNGFRPVLHLQSRTAHGRFLSGQAQPNGFNSPDASSAAHWDGRMRLPDTLSLHHSYPRPLGLPVSRSTANPQASAVNCASPQSPAAWVNAQPARENHVSERREDNRLQAEHG